eukprot:1149738-Pelagomonas_calceolata.AAC.5
MIQWHRASGCAQVLDEEYDMVHQAFATDSRDQSPWMYYRYGTCSLHRLPSLPEPLRSWTHTSNQAHGHQAGLRAQGPCIGPNSSDQCHIASPMMQHGKPFNANPTVQTLQGHSCKPTGANVASPLMQAPLMQMSRPTEVDPTDANVASHLMQAHWCKYCKPIDAYDLTDANR